MTASQFNILVNHRITCMILYVYLVLYAGASIVVRHDGDFIIGGLFNLHSSTYIVDDTLSRGPIEETCVGFSWGGFLRSQVMTYAVDEINNRSDILCNITLGYDIRDVCSSTSKSLSETFDLMVRNEVQVGAVIGAGGSDTTMAVAELLSVYNVPMLSYAATTSMLDDPVKYKSFLRTVPNDIHQANAMVELVTSFDDWNWVGIIGIDNFYGRPATAEFEVLAKKRGVCIALYELILPNCSDDIVDDVIDKIYENPSAKVIVAFLYWDEISRIVQRMALRNITDRILVASEAWSMSTSIASTELERQVTEGSLGVVLPARNIPGFYDYINKLNPFNENNILVSAAWETAFNCSMPMTAKETRPTTQGGARNNTAEIMTSSVESHIQHSGYITHIPTTVYCSGEESFSTHLNDSLSSSAFLYRVYLAVYAIAHALDDITRCEYPDGLLSGGTCPDVWNLKPWQLLKYLQNVNFTDVFGHHISFDDDGGVGGVYDIVNWQNGNTKVPAKCALMDDGQSDMSNCEPSWDENDSILVDESKEHPEYIQVVKIGRYDHRQISMNNGLQINHGDITWKNSCKTIPTSRCSAPCDPGKRKGILSGFPTCCYECITCSEGTITNDTDSTDCTKCPEGTWPNDEQTMCKDKYLEYLAWDNPEAIACMVLAGLGILATVIVMATFLKFRNTPVVKASNRELSLLFMGSLIVCFLSVFSCMGEPTNTQCVIQVPLRSLSFTMCVSILLVKTHQIMTVFESKVPRAGRCLFKAQLQVFVVLVLTAGQGIVVFLWLCLNPPKAVYFPNIAKEVIYLECDSDFSAPILVMFAYTWVIAAVCLGFAFRTRKLPENFNESKFITFAMVIYFMAWLTYFPSYFGTNGRFKALCQVILLLASSYAMLLCILIPKCFVILFKPHLNTTEYVRSTTLSHANRRASAVMDTRRRKSMINPVLTSTENIEDGENCLHVDTDNDGKSTQSPSEPNHNQHRHHCRQLFGENNEFTLSQVVICHHDTELDSKVNVFRVRIIPPSPQSHISRTTMCPASARDSIELVASHGLDNPTFS
ncbi:extracellular calcium-sensing receptor-like [Saccoglossus kowalevskii]|uniref:Extracellular calcium-sensing receptor-like n=1 Tax=Saccoglossus kowalevskii TaxID=10224 RepID=A0ABM0GK31_SACKO|nr:PREDICTED: extracellular calcium-sensing receptor-like [Saccoglossus kowalevskii]